MFCYSVSKKEWASNYWLQGGAPADKLVIGLALYGKAFELEDPNDNGMGAPVKSGGANGVAWAYHEVSLF